jgi:hypothetical protein
MTEGEDPESEFAVANAGAGNINDMSVYGVADVRKAIEDRNKLAMEQQRRYDAQVEEIKARRAGPSFSERMFQLSAALATPTEQRGLGGILANVTPVLAAQQRAKRQDELTRREALEELEAKRLTQQMGLANQDVTTQLALARLGTTANKPVDPFKGAVYDPNTMRWVPRPGTAGAPPVLTPEQAAELARDPKNRGMKFYTTDGRPMEIK